MEQRRFQRKSPFRTQPDLTVIVGLESFRARIVDLSEEGYGLETPRRLEVGCRVRLKGELLHGTAVRRLDVGGVVRWSIPSANGTFTCGVMVEKAAGAETFDASEPDYYEVLQLSPNADPDTVHRVFRVLAQRFHPDNKETGDEGIFKSVLRAYETLSDPVQRAAYDAQRPAQQQKRFRIFEAPEAAVGVEGEKRKRQGILLLLYMRRVREPRDPGMGLLEFEQMLGCPREHLDFALWFLRESGWVLRSDSGRFSITARGVERAEEMGPAPLADHKLIAAAGAGRG
ncbi:MAG: DnaJ domain-containing protein [Acidobacteria bacterium]|nr:DnaJ domain-containing protein [Acidobacteriota bacterium]